MTDTVVLHRLLKSLVQGNRSSTTSNDSRNEFVLVEEREVLAGIEMERVDEPCFFFFFPLRSKIWTLFHRTVLRSVSLSAFRPFEIYEPKERRLRNENSSTSRVIKFRGNFDNGWSGTKSLNSEKS